jgi:hypothetical protein
MKKTPMPKAVREQVWLIHMGQKYSTICPVRWCQNKITVFDFHVAHNIPESKGGSQDLSNLRPICVRCNLSMGKTYTIEEWEHSFSIKRISWFQYVLTRCSSYWKSISYRYFGENDEECDELLSTKAYRRNSPEDLV